MGVFSRGVPINQFQVLFTSCIDICLQVLQVGTRCHLFTSWYMLSLCGHLFTSWYTLSLCGHLFTSWYTLSLCGHLFTSCYNVLQVHVSPRSEVTFGNDVIHRNSTAKTGSKVSLYTTHVSAEPMGKSVERKRLHAFSHVEKILLGLNMLWNVPVSWKGLMPNFRISKASRWNLISFLSPSMLRLLLHPLSSNSNS